MRLNQRHVTAKNQQVAMEIAKERRRHHDRMAGAKLPRLMRKLHFAAGQRLFHHLSLVADHQYLAIQPRLTRLIYDVIDYISSAYLVQHFGDIGFHPFPLAGSQNDGDPVESAIQFPSPSSIISENYGNKWRKIKFAYYSSRP